MKRLNLGILFIILCCPLSYGQFSLVAEGGANYAKIAWLGNVPEDIDNFYEYALGYVVAVIPSYQFTKKVKLATALQYSVEGYTIDGFTGMLDFNLSYIRLAPQVQFKVLGPFSIIGGGSWGYLARQTVSTEGGPIGILPKFVENQKFDYGVMAGMSAEVLNFIFSLRYNFGLASLNEISFNDREGRIIGEADQVNRNFQLGIGYRFGFRK